MLDRLINSETRARRAVLQTLPKNGVGIEIGVWKGDFSSQLLRWTQPRALHLVDPWIASPASDRSSEAWYGADRITQARMDSIHEQVQARFAAQTKARQVIIHRRASGEFFADLDRGSVDFVYIDGDHSYEAVVTDIAEGFRVTRPGGFLVCDDYLLGAWWKDGVVRAVHEALVQFPLVIHSKINSQIRLRKRALD